MILKEVIYDIDSIKEGKFYIERDHKYCEDWILGFDDQLELRCAKFTYEEGRDYVSKLSYIKSIMNQRAFINSLMTSKNNEGRFSLYEIVENKFYIDL